VRTNQTASVNGSVKAHGDRPSQNPQVSIGTAQAAAVTVETIGSQSTSPWSCVAANLMAARMSGRGSPPAGTRSARAHLLQ
jgi:hypothetical protein